MQMRARSTLAAVVVAVATLAGCAGTAKVMLGDARPPLDPSEVRIYSTRPPGSIDIAQLEASSGAGFGSQAQTDEVMARLRREAAAIGANGVVMLGMGSSGAPVGMSVGAASYGSSSATGISFGIPTTQRQAAGVAIYVPPATQDRVEPPSADEAAKTER
jgi:hypothetical protein